MKFNEASITEVAAAGRAAAAAFQQFKLISRELRAVFLETIATELEANRAELLATASAETNLPAEPRLATEFARTVYQMRMFAEMLRAGDYLATSIDTAILDRLPAPKPDVRKMLFPVGTIAVFGASNFPFAYSTAGGDTASALAAGCAVIVKAHPNHAETSEKVAAIIQKCVEKCQMPPRVFQHIHGGNEIGKALVQNENVAAVGFTGSFAGGMALHGYAQERGNPIPVFAEMGSTNPAVFLPDALKTDAAKYAKMFAASVSGSLGQFCTKPGLLLAIDSPDFDRFLELLSAELALVAGAKMLHAGIYQSFVEKSRAVAANAAAVFQSSQTIAESEVAPFVAQVSGGEFLNDEKWREEIFGPFALVIKCRDDNELIAAWKATAGQLTTSLIGTEQDFANFPDLLMIAPEIAGRIIFNGVPTGVEVCPSIVHGGKFPATTDARFTAVGIDAVKRWLRPVCLQNCPENLLPAELKNENPAKIPRLVNNKLTNEAIISEK